MASYVSLLRICVCQAGCQAMTKSISFVSVSNLVTTITLLYHYTSDCRELGQCKPSAGLLFFHQLSCFFFQRASTCKLLIAHVYSSISQLSKGPFRIYDLGTNRLGGLTLRAGQILVPLPLKLIPLPWASQADLNYSPPQKSDRN